VRVVAIRTGGVEVTPLAPTPTARDITTLPVNQLTPEERQAEGLRLVKFSLQRNGPPSDGDSAYWESRANELAAAATRYREVYQPTNDRPFIFDSFYNSMRLDAQLARFNAGLDSINLDYETLNQGAELAIQNGAPARVGTGAVSMPGMSPNVAALYGRPLTPALTQIGDAIAVEATADFMGPLTPAQNAVVQRTGFVLDDTEANQVGQLSNQGALDWWPTSTQSPSKNGGAITSTINGMPSTWVYQIVANVNEQRVPVSYSAFNKFTGKIDYLIGQTGLGTFMANEAYYREKGANARPYEVASGQFVNEMLNGNFLAAGSAYVQAWGEAIKDPQWLTFTALNLVGGVVANEAILIRGATNGGRGALVELGAGRGAVAGEVGAVNPGRGASMSVDGTPVVPGGGKVPGVQGANGVTAAGELTGTRTAISAAEDAATIRSLTRENESATTLANNGYTVQQNPATLPNGKNPDYIVNGQVFDNYAPSTGNVRNAADVIGGKVAGGQADNVVVNLADSSITPSALREQLTNYPIPGLKQVIIIDKTGAPTVIKFLGK
jgi:Contact-dependent growth inhibition CdiA C-terminal domain